MTHTIPNNPLGLLGPPLWLEFHLDLNNYAQWQNLYTNKPPEKHLITVWPKRYIKRKRANSSRSSWFQRRQGIRMIRTLSPMRMATSIIFVWHDKDDSGPTWFKQKCRKSYEIYIYIYINIRLCVCIYMYICNSERYGVQEVITGSWGLELEAELLPCWLPRPPLTTAWRWYQSLLLVPFRFRLYQRFLLGGWFIGPCRPPLVYVHVNAHVSATGNPFNWRSLSTWVAGSRSPPLAGNVALPPNKNIYMLFMQFLTVGGVCIYITCGLERWSSLYWWSSMGSPTPSPSLPLAQLAPDSSASPPLSSALLSPPPPRPRLHSLSLRSLPKKPCSRALSHKAEEWALP